ncbi:MAG: NAD(P)-dependent glycerol-3-phosphate dehydrogenase [Burkholderiaceae bacterium]|jgi:glycerol-3-phosphate dehydrogenase (NAD(P)+)|nr:NAD(P)-dependent glycerol-3-phosphate dehydrogenase [Burkholderiaceae bacterium]
MKICILGAGAWGTALAVNVAARHTVTLWARDEAQVQAMQAVRENRRYLPGITLPDSLAIRGGPVIDVARGADLVIIATPMAALRQMLSALCDLRIPIAWLCKGVEPVRGGGQQKGSAESDVEGDKENRVGLLPHEICAQVAPKLAAAAFSGPSFALEVARGQPTAVVAASADERTREALVRAFHGPALRVYANDDLVGVEVGSAVKNVLAVATGLADGLSLGLNARAALITRGLAEMTRLGVALGARVDTFMGLSGLGDLVLTATGDLSRNRQIGLLLAQGRTLDEAVQSLGHVAEGVNCARVVLHRAQKLGVEMPVTAAVVALFDGLHTPAQAVAALMGREPTVEQV